MSERAQLSRMADAADNAKEDRLRVNEEANRLYDKYNPKPHEKISVPKDQCIREARQRLGLDK